MYFLIICRQDDLLEKIGYTIVHQASVFFGFLAYISRARYVPNGLSQYSTLLGLN